MELEIKLRTAKMRGMIHKVWITVSDGGARSSHIRADRQRVKIDEPFIIGGQRLRIPSDPMARYEETANCRCDVEFVKLQNGLNFNQNLINGNTVIDSLIFDNRRVPTFGQIRPIKLNLGKTQRYNFVAGRLVKVIIRTANGIPFQFSGFRIDGEVHPLDRQGNAENSIGNSTITDGGHTTQSSPVSRFFDAGFDNEFGFRWKLTCAPATASDLPICEIYVSLTDVDNNITIEDLEEIDHVMTFLVYKDQLKYRFLGSGWGSGYGYSKMSFSIGAPTPKAYRYLKRLIKDMKNASRPTHPIRKIDFAILYKQTHCKTVDCPGDCDGFLEN